MKFGCVRRERRDGTAYLHVQYSITPSSLVCCTLFGNALPMNWLSVPTWETMGRVIKRRLYVLICRTLAVFITVTGSLFLLPVFNASVFIIILVSNWFRRSTYITETYVSLCVSVCRDYSLSKMKFKVLYFIDFDM